MDQKYKGIVIKLTDYKDADKLASIFTLEQGIITVKFTGVKKENAKFKAMAQPFVFADFVVNVKGANKTVISANLIDGFSGILSDYNKTLCAYIVLDMIKSLIPAEKKEEELFLFSLTALKNIETSNEMISTIKYILNFIASSGMELNFPESNYVNLDKMTGNFTTNSNQNTQQIDKKVYLTLKSINADEEVEVSQTTLKQILHLMHNIIYLKFNEDIRSFEFI